jgi:hypothetical protein
MRLPQVNALNKRFLPFKLEMRQNQLSITSDVIHTRAGPPTAVPPTVADKVFACATPERYLLKCEYAEIV